MCAKQKIPTKNVSVEIVNLDLHHDIFKILKEFKIALKNETNKIH